MRLVHVLLAIAIVVAIPVGAARADDGDVARAKQAFTRGMAHYHLREYGQAIAAFEEGYRTHPDPVFLFNIAQAHRLAERYEEALHFYRTYLSAAPRTPDRKIVEARIEELRALVRAHKTVSAAPPQGALTPGSAEKPPAPEAPAAVPAKAPALVEQPVVVEKPPQAAPAVERPRAARLLVAKPAARPEVERKRKWVLGLVIGGAVVAVGAAVGLGVGLTVGRPSASSAYPSVSYALDAGVR